MNCRPYGSKPTLALWMLVAVADLVILASATGPVTVLLIIAALLVVTAGVFAARGVHRPAPAKVTVRRRA